MSSKFDLITIGSGPGGYVAAIRASQLGLKTAVIEREELGGTCLNWGCIPTKSLLASAHLLEEVKRSKDFGIQTGEVKPDFGEMINQSRKVASDMKKGIEFLFKKNKIEHIKGYGSLKKPGLVEIQTTDKSMDVAADHIILATGAHTKTVDGISIDNKHIISSKDALIMDTLPESMVILGAGAMGLEFGYIFNALGASVTIIEALSRIAPEMDADVSKALKRALSKKGIKFQTDAMVESVSFEKGQCVCRVKGKKGTTEVTSEKVLVTLGVIGNIENIGLENCGIKTVNGKIEVDGTYTTNKKGIYAIGDVIQSPQLAHVASAEGIACVESIAGKPSRKLDYNNVPYCIYTHPEAAGIGYTEQAAKDAGYDVKTGNFPLMASGKAKAGRNTDGMVKVIYDAKYGECLGAHIVAENATELISQVMLSRKMEGTGKELIQSIFPHPTLSEALMEASAQAYGEVIHL